MDTERFDSWVRALTGVRSRRGTLVGLLGGGLGLIGLTEAEAKKHKKHKKKKGGGAPPPPACTPVCAGKACGDDGCGGSCGSCGGTACVSGACSCTGQPDLTGCGGGRQCSGGVCATPPPCGGWRRASLRPQTGPRHPVELPYSVVHHDKRRSSAAL